MTVLGRASVRDSKRAPSPIPGRHSSADLQTALCWCEASYVAVSGIRLSQGRTLRCDLPACELAELAYLERERSR